MKMQIIIAASYQFYLKILLCTFYVNTVKGKFDKVGLQARFEKSFYFTYPLKFTRLFRIHKLFLTFHSTGLGYIN